MYPFLVTLPGNTFTLFLGQRLRAGATYDLRIVDVHENCCFESSLTPDRPAKEIEITIPPSLDPGAYLLQLSLATEVMEEVTVMVATRAEIGRTQEFLQASQLWKLASRAMESADFVQARQLFREAAIHYLRAKNTELASRALWEVLALDEQASGRSRPEAVSLPPKAEHGAFADSVSSYHLQPLIEVLSASTYLGLTSTSNDLLDLMLATLPNDEGAIVCISLPEHLPALPALRTKGAESADVKTLVKAALQDLPASGEAWEKRLTEYLVA